MLEPMKTLPRPRSRGLTLLELAIVLVIVVILAGLALPPMGARLERQRVRGAAEALAGDLAEARYEATRRGLPLFVETRLGADWCWSVATAPNCECGAPASCQVHTAHAGDHRGVRLVGGLAAKFDTTGTPQAVQAAALETSKGDRLRVELTPLGRPRICVEKGQWPQLPAC